MPGSKLKLTIRRNQILQQLHKTGKVTVTQLSADLGTTQVTIRSDLAAMEREGLLLRVQGGAVPAANAASHEQHSFSRDTIYAREKQWIARCAVEQIHDGDTLFLNSGSTALFVADGLRCRKNLNVVTNSLAVATRLGGTPTIRVTLLGGEINAQYGFTYGGDTQEQLGRYQADWVILSVEGVSTEGGITTRHPEEAVIDRMMIARSKAVLVVADHTKIGRVGFASVCQRQSKTTLVTDAAAREDALSQLQGHGWEIVTA